MPPPLLSVMVVMLAAALPACSADEVEEAETPTYYGDAKAIIDARCATCHSEGNIGPLPLTTYEEVDEFSASALAAIVSGAMPPWQPADDCNSYEGNFDLTADERQTLLAFFNGGAPAGEPADAPPESEPDTVEFETDLSLRLPEPYVPVREPDDYRCQLIEWPADETRFVTGVRVTPEQRSIVHHVILFLATPEQVEEYRAFDEAEEGPGYTCYGGPRASDASGALDGIEIADVLAALERIGVSPLDFQAGNVTAEQFAELMDELGIDVGGFRSIGSWVPGAPPQPFPEGTGIRVEPGSLIVAQFHYNTLTADPVSDHSTIEIATVDSVEREATMLPALDLGWVSNGVIGEPMTIPAGESNVEHSMTATFDSMFMSLARQTLGLGDSAPLVIHSANHHMHELGVRQRTELRHADGTTSCVLDIPDWDFQWQGSYALADPITLRSGDALWMGCTWDNSEANQPIIDGEVREPIDVAWGEGTSDEMCLGAYYVTAQ